MSKTRKNWDVPLKLLNIVVWKIKTYHHKGIRIKGVIKFLPVFCFSISFAISLYIFISLKIVKIPHAESCNITWRIHCLQNKLAIRLWSSTLVLLYSKVCDRGFVCVFFNLFFFWLRQFFLATDLKIRTYLTEVIYKKDILVSTFFEIPFFYRAFL